jgi:hypothetical protein
MVSTAGCGRVKTGKTLKCAVRPTLHAALHDRKSYSGTPAPQVENAIAVSSYLMRQQTDIQGLFRPTIAELPVNNELTGKCEMLEIGLV